MLIQRAYKTELDPNETQKRLFYQYAGALRFAYNWMLARREEYYKETGKMISGYDLTKEFRALKDTQFPWFRQFANKLEETAASNLDAAYDRFFKMRKDEIPRPKLRKPRRDGKPAGFPRFMSRKQGVHAFKFWTIKREWIQPDRIRFQRIGWVRLKERSYLPTPGRDVRIMSATISEKAGRWFVSVQVEEEIEDAASGNAIVGIDIGITVLATASDGRTWGNPKALDYYLKRLQNLGKQLSRRKKGSNRWQQTKRRIANLHYQIACIRSNAIHDMTTEILARAKSEGEPPCLIVIEDLQVRNMLQNNKLSKAIADASFAEIRRQLEYKAAWSGTEVLVVDKFFASSKICSSCGCKNTQLTLADRTFVCQNCGLEIDRDLSAALNLRRAGLEYVTLKTSGRKTDVEAETEAVSECTGKPVKRQAEKLSAVSA